MKKLKIILVLICITFGLILNAQSKKKSFKGVVTYDVSYTSKSDELSPAKLASMPKEKVMRILGDKSIVETTVEGVSFSVISNGENMTYVTLLDLMGKKVAIRKSKDEIETLFEESKAPVIEYIDESKMIAGYKCSKAIVTIFDEYDEESKFEVFYTEELASEKINFMDVFRGLKGLPMAYVLESDQISIKYEAVIVKKGKVKPIEFIMPVGYEILTEEEFQELIKSMQ